MEKSEMIKNVRAMMKFADEKMKGVVKEDTEYMLERTPYHYIKFVYYPKQGACIEYGCWSNTYKRLFANKTAEYGGWVGSEDVNSYENTHKSVIRDDMMREAMLAWNSIKEHINTAIEKEQKIDNFVL